MQGVKNKNQEDNFTPLYKSESRPWSRSKRSSCPGGTGKFGFNTYNLMAFMLMSFNQVNRCKYLHKSNKQT